MPMMRRVVCPIACFLAVGLVAHAAQDTADGFAGQKTTRKPQAKAAGQASKQEFGHAADGTLLAGCKLLRDDAIPMPLTFERLEMTHVGPEAEAIRETAKKENAAVFIPESVPIAPVDVDAAFAGLSATDLSLEGRSLPFKTKALQEKGFLVTWGDDQEDVTLYVRWHAVGRRMMYMDSKALRESVVCRKSAKR